LYGYANSPRAEGDLIPVVAFADLERADQVKLFMQINENQQAVPKNLRNTLNADLLSESSDRREQIKSLKLQLAQNLGESRTSPLYGRILIGENRRNATRCITIDAVSHGVERANFLGSFTRTEVKEMGTFYRGSNEATLGPLYNYLSLCFNYVRERLDTQFRLGSADGGFVFINNGIESLIRIFGDVVDHLVAKNGYNPRDVSPSDFFQEAQYYLDPMLDMLAELNPAEGKEYRGLYGSGAGTKYWRRLQVAIAEARTDFQPAGLAEYLESEEKQFNQESLEMVAELEHVLKSEIRKRLEDEFGAAWQKRGIPRKVYMDAAARATEKNLDRSLDEEVDLWDCLFILDYLAILRQNHELWKRIFEKRFTRPDDENKPGGWKARTDWVEKLNERRNDVAHGRAISAEGHEFLVTLTTWLVKGQADNEL
jgi:DNA sulfur modification protein DndB